MKKIFRFFTNFFFIINIFLFFNYLFSVYTNKNINFHISKNKINFLDEFFITYHVLNYQNIISIEKPNFNFSDLSIIIDIITNYSNVFIIKVKNYEINNFKMPSFIISAQKSKDYYSIDKFYTPDIFISQNTKFNEINELEHIEEIYEFHDFTFVLIIFIIIILSIIGYFGIKYYSKNKGNKNEEIKNTDYFSEIYNEFMKLNNVEVNLINYKEIFSKISYLFRKFIELSYNIPALEMSTTEIKNYFLNNNNLEEKTQILKILEYVLYNCDIVKYANYYPENRIKNNLIEYSVLFLNLTKKILDKDNTNNS